MRVRLIRAALRTLAVPLLLTAAAPAAHSSGPDMILHGGRIYTGNAEQPYVEAIAIRGARVSAVGDSSTILKSAKPSTRIFDLAGRMAIPGINDAHDHPGNVPFGASADTGASPQSDPPLEAVATAIGKAAQGAPPGAWVHAVVGATALRDVAAARAAVDAAARGRPVVLSAWWGHGVVLNARGLELMNLDDRTPDPLGGQLERDASGRITGKLDEYAGWRVLRQLQSAASDEAQLAHWRGYTDRRLREGVTSVQVMSGDQTPAALARALGRAQLPIRLRLIRFPMSVAEAESADPWAKLQSRLPPLTRVSGVKWVLDGTPIEGLAFQSKPYRDRPGWRGRPNFTTEHLHAQLARALAGGEPLHLHAVGDAMAGLVLDEMERMAPPERWRRARVRLEHANGIVGPQLERAKRLGIVLAQPRPTAPIGQWLRAGVPVAYGSDMGFPPFAMLAAITADANPGALTREEGLAVLTRWPAYAESAEVEKGMLVPGMLADIAVLSQDVIRVPAAALPATKSLLTIVGGRIAYAAPEFNGDTKR
ncbi:amidohydrolase [uncultured Sphingomonas sp.]|uniref:amidohydrolase n=1 Tax=uncultured Sphingomonas sp. TaxID=158754 RepID=UPI0035CB88A6